MVKRVVEIEVQTKGQAKINKLDRSVDNLDKSAKRATGSMSRLSKAALAVSGALVIQKVIQYGDAWAGVQNKLRQVTTSTEDLAQTTEDLFKIAQSSRSSLEATTGLYFRLSQAAETLGINSKQALEITESLANSLTATGLTAAETASVLLQTSQAFNKGKLNGDEFRTLAEAMPSILRLVTKELGIGRNELNKYAEAGKITGQVLANSLINNLEESRKTLAASSITYSQATQKVENSTIRALGAFENLNGFFARLSGNIDTFSGILDGVSIALTTTDNIFSRLETNGKGVLGVFELLSDSSAKLSNSITENITANPLVVQGLTLIRDAFDAITEAIAKTAQQTFNLAIGLELAPQKAPKLTDIVTGGALESDDVLSPDQKKFTDNLKIRLEQELQIRKTQQSARLAILGGFITEEESIVALATQRELIALDNRQTNLLTKVTEDQARDLGLLQDFEDQRLIIVEESEGRISQIRIDASKAQVAAFVSSSATFFSALQQINTKSQGLQKLSIVANTADAVIKTYNNAGGYPLGIAPALIMAGIGAKAFSQVGKSSFGGGASSGGGGGAVSSPGINSPTQTELTTINTIESTAITDLANELRNLDPDAVLPVSFIRRVVAGVVDAEANGQV